MSGTLAPKIERKRKIDPRTNFCGAYWSDGKFQPSVKNPTKQPVNEFDVTCRDHDVSLAHAETEQDVLSANRKFYESNIDQGIERSIAAILVHYLYPFKMPKNKNQKTGNLRGSPSMAQLTKAIKEALPAAKNQNKKKKNQNNRVGSITTAPVSIGTTVRGQSQSISHGKNACIISGRDYVTAVQETNQTNWFLGAVVPISPLYFANMALGTLAKSYRYYRFSRLVAHFVTRQPTSATGEIILVHHPNVSKEFYNSTTTAFLPRVMSAKNSVMGPVWLNHSLPLAIDSSFRETDGISNLDIDDNILGEFLVYVQSAITDVVGYVLIDYTLELKELYINEQAPSMPLTYCSERIVASDSVSPPVINTLASFNVPPTITSAAYSNGTILKIILDITGTVFPVGVTAANALYVLNRTTQNGLTLVDGTTLYAVVSGGPALAIFPTIEAAATQSDTVYMQYRTVGAAATQWAFTHYVVQWGNTTKT